MPDAPLIDRTLVTPIVLDDVHGRLEFAPLADITPLDGALICQLFTAMAIRRSRLDWREYLTRYGLDRHFKDAD